LTDAAKNFITLGVKVGDTVTNTTTPGTTTVTAVGTTVLTLQSNVFASAGDGYSVGSFINAGVKIGDIIYNYSTPYAATVTAVDSATQLSITGAGMAPGRAYDLYASHDTPNNGCVLYVGVAGDVKVTTAGGDDVTFTGILAGSFIPVQVVKVFATPAPPANIVALW